MKVTIEVTGPELVLLYLATGNEDAGRIAADVSETNPYDPHLRRERISNRAEA